jgi:hypothetical protein
MRLLKYFIIVFLVSSTYSQTIYELTPGSKSNVFELSFLNSTGSSIQSFNIAVDKTPEWIEFSKSEINIDKIKNTDKPTAQFYFNIKENAPVGEEGKVIFKITDQSDRKWFKSYNVKVSPPKVFEVHQNYPNPFNPSTTIKYSIPQDAFVTIKVYNVLGEKVSELINSEIKAGIHEVIFNADNTSSGVSSRGGYASGVYFYVVEARGLDGKKYFDSKKMILLK